MRIISVRGSPTLWMESRSRFLRSIMSINTGGCQHGYNKLLSGFSTHIHRRFSLSSSPSARTHLFPYNSRCHGYALTRAQSPISRMHGAFQVNESFLVGSCVLTAGGRPLRHPGGVFHVFITLGILFQCYSGGTVVFHQDIL